MSRRRSVVALLGGLGNQLFQVAFGHWLEERSGLRTWYDVSFQRNLALDALSLPGIGAEVRERILAWSRWLPSPQGRLAPLGRGVRIGLGPSRIVRNLSGPGPTLRAELEPSWWFGYWQRCDYADALVPDLHSALAATTPNAPVAAVGVHIRRGDMLATPTAVPPDWFARALDALRRGNHALESCPVHVWSDDPEWCRTELDLGSPFDVMPAAAPVAHLAALANCSGLVISRSTFSWWAARLAMDRGAAVVYPSPWWTDMPDLDRTLAPAVWRPEAVRV